MGKQGKTYIVLLNWNGWADTLECLESVFRSDYPDYRVIVCDNDSQDGSLEKIKAWADGERRAPQGNPALAYLSRPPSRKPIAYVELDRAGAESGGMHGEEPPLILIRTGGNLGFAGGNNVGLRYALARGDFAYAWLLNNDTVIAADALRRMVERMKQAPHAGMCGSTLRYYHEPDRIQARGGVAYCKWRCLGMPIGFLQHADRKVKNEEVERRMSYVIGASMLVRREFLEEVGLMEEDYFLYFEEFDWVRRAKGSYGLVYAQESVIYHKEGGSIGTDSAGKQSALSIFYFQRSRVKFLRKFFKPYLPLFFLRLCLEAARALARRDFFSLKWSLIALLGIDARKVGREKRAV